MSTIKKIFFNKLSILILTLVVTEYVTSIFLYYNKFYTTGWNNLYNVVLVFIPLLGGIIGINRYRQWGGWRSIIGKAILLLSIGQISWALGSLVWVVNYFLNGDSAPYPSIADVFYIFVYPLWGAGIMFLGLTATVNDGTRFRNRVLSVCMPIFMGLVTYYLIAVNLHDGRFLEADYPLKIFFDIVYPMGDIAILAILVMVCGGTYNYFGQRIKVPINLIVVFLTLNYVADFVFSYTTTVGTFYSGSFGDVLFATSLALLSLSLNRLTPSLLEDK